MRINVELKERQIREKVTNNNFGKRVATEWKRLIDPYTPRDTSALMSNVSILPFKIHYMQNYARPVYNGSKKMTFRKKNPYATDHWDKKAEAAGQKAKLYRSLNNS